MIKDPGGKLILNYRTDLPKEELELALNYLKLFLGSCWEEYREAVKDFIRSVSIHCDWYFRSRENVCLHVVAGLTTN